jgi:ferredoxin
MYVFNCEQHFSYFDPDYPTFTLNVTGLARVHCNAIVCGVCLCVCMSDAISRLGSRPSWEVNRNILDMVWDSSEKCIFAEGLCRVGSWP